MRTKGPTKNIVIQTQGRKYATWTSASRYSKIFRKAMGGIKLAKLWSVVLFIEIGLWRSGFTMMIRLVASWIYSSP